MPHARLHLNLSRRRLGRLGSLVEVSETLELICWVMLGKNVPRPAPPPNRVAYREDWAAPVGAVARRKRGRSRAG